MNFFQCIIVESANLIEETLFFFCKRNKNCETHLHVIGTGDDPILAGNEAGASNGKIAYLIKTFISDILNSFSAASHLEIFHHLLVFIVHDMDVTIVQSTQHPWLGRMKIH